MPNASSSSAIALLTSLLLTPIACGTSRRAEQIFTNGHVITMNDSAPQAEALAVGRGKIVAVGSSQEMRVARSLAAQSGAA